MTYTEIIGLSAGFLIAFGLVPQVLRVWRLRDAQEISLTFNLLSVGGTALWFTYGLSLGLLSVIIWNGVNLILYVLLLAVKLKFGTYRSSTGSRPLPDPSRSSKS